MLEQLEPRTVWKYFEEFCSIPHPSGHEDRAQKYVIDCAAKLGLTAITDITGNVLIRKKATPNASDRKTVVLQSHLDMVPQKNAATAHDFKNDPIKPVIDGEWVKAQGTTLGADNGIGVAIALAVLESRSINHAPVEALFTLDEERGMTGA
ncbi:MAG: M20/M25/M40 family metallo-hydrolase, partial [Chitinispirillaceae bacterium]|nr:M20/M25/M40 family metallo-hydrolase [Chitinispirillaceae bacterium]